MTETSTTPVENKKKARASKPKPEDGLRAFIKSELDAATVLIANTFKRASDGQSRTPLIFGAMRKVMEAVGPLAKRHQNETGDDDGGFWFRKMDEIVSVLQPLMAEHGILPVPEVLERVRESRPDADGFNQNWTLIRIRWRLFSAIDGSVFPPDNMPCIVDGEGMSDMSFSTAAAITMSMKQALCQLFMIPVFGDDPEAYQGNKTQYVATVTPAEPRYTEPKAVGEQPALFSEPIGADVVVPSKMRTTGTKRKGKLRPGEVDDDQNVGAEADPDMQHSLDQPTGPSGGPMTPGSLAIIGAELKRQKKEEQSVVEKFGPKESWQRSQLDSIVAFIKEPVADV